MSHIHSHSESNPKGSQEDDFRKRSLLAKAELFLELKRIKVSIKKNTTPFLDLSELPVDRAIDDPVKISAYVHVRKAPNVPIFGPNILVNQSFEEDRTVYQSDDHSQTSEARSRSRSRSHSERRERSYSRYRKKRDRSRSDSRQYESRERSRRRTRSRSSSKQHKLQTRESRERSRRRSRSRSSSKQHRSRTRDRRRSGERRRSSHGRYSKKSRSRSTGRRRRRSITPLRPGEYRPGHPDLALPVEQRRHRSTKTRSRSLRNSKDDKARSSPSSSRSKEGISREKSSRRSPVSPHSRDKWYSNSRHRSPHPPPMLMPGMEHGYEAYPPIPMYPYKGPFPPMMDRNFYPHMPPLYRPVIMRPRNMVPMVRLPRSRYSIYNQVTIYNKSVALATTDGVTSTEVRDEGKITVESTVEASKD